MQNNQHVILEFTVKDPISAMEESLLLQATKFVFGSGLTPIAFTSIGHRYFATIRSESLEIELGRGRLEQSAKVADVSLHRCSTSAA